jgi:lipopolysaccharide biosynthesis regulator YciM
MRNTLGNVLLRQGHREQAVDEFVAASREDPRLAVALFNAGFTCAEMPERRQQAILYLQRFVETRGGGERTPREYLDMAQNKLAELQTVGAH